jgi:hypothetical protein
MATLQRPRADFSKEKWSTSDDSPSVVHVQPAQVQLDLVHEIGGDLIGSSVRRDHLIDPSNVPTLVSVVSHVVSDAARGMNSPEYLATVRRRKTAKIKNAITSLTKKTRREDFAAFTFRIVEEIRDLLIQLNDVQREGNTREILRQVRDTFFDGGHERYLEDNTRELVASIFDRLSTADEVVPEDVDRVWDELYESGLSASIHPVFSVTPGNGTSGGD